MNTENINTAELETYEDCMRTKRKRRIVLIVSISLVLLLVFIFITTFEFPVEYEEIADKIVFEEKDGELIIKIKDFNYSSGSQGTGNNEYNDEEKVIYGSYYIGFNTTIWRKYINKKDEKLIAVLKDDEITPMDDKGNELNYTFKLTKVYYRKFYYEANKGIKDIGEPILIWEKEKPE